MASSGTREIRPSTCPLCEAMCGINVAVAPDGRVQSVRPNPDDVWSRGHMCPKGTALGELHHDPERLRRPVIREGRSWREADWDEALDRVRELALGVRERHGPGAFAAHMGNVGGGKDAMISRYAGMFLSTAGISSVYSSSTVDQIPKNLSAYLMFGNEWRIPIPDIDNTDLFLIMGGNPAASKGSIFSYSDVMGKVRDIRARGGRVIVIDPVRTGTAQAADQWIAVRPGTDAALLLAVAQQLFEHGKVRLRHLADHVTGLDAVERVVRSFTPERVSDFCGVSPEVIRELALELGSTDRAAIYGRIGLCTQKFGTLASWLVDVLAVLTGNLDREGGTMWSTPVAALVDMLATLPAGTPTVTGRTRVSGVPIILGQPPVTLLAEEIATPGKGQHKGFVTFGSNPVLSVPGSDRLSEALTTLECMISFDSYLNETTRHAHVVFPSPSFLQDAQWDYFSWIFNLTSGGHYSPAILPLEQGRPEAWRVFATVAGMIGGIAEPDADAIDDGWFSMLAQGRGIDPSIALAHSPQRGPERINDLAIRMGPWGDRFGASPGGFSLDSFRDKPNGMIVGKAQPCAHLGFPTPSGKIELAPEFILSDLPRLEAAMAAPYPSLVMVSRRTLRSMNSWMHNLPTLVAGKPRCTLQIHPEDAARFGLAAGDRAEVRSATGTIEAPVEITSNLRPGVVSMPHGWGHDDPHARTSVARRHAGVNLNALSPNNLHDTPSGNAVLNGFEVAICKVVEDVALEKNAISSAMPV